MSTADFQDYATSRAWQRNAADELVAGKGVVVVEFFDRGCSRRVEWADRPAAGMLLAALADPDRGFDAVVVGEYERAFFGDQLHELLPVFARNGVQVWLPETNGPVDAADPTHRALVMLLGAQSKREVLRSRFRVLAAMRIQVVEQGRYLGGRPPYGYRLVDAGPHPNTAHAQWGRRLQRLEPDPVAARHVRWIFAQRLSGRSASRIAHDLNVRGVPCPSSAGPARNPHRRGAGWTLRTVATILANPRYTGRQVWNRQHTDHDSAAMGRKRAGQRWNQPEDWVISKVLAHPALVSEGNFIAAQAVDATPTPADGTARSYALVGLVVCRMCGRRMDSHWVHGRPGYRCRHGHTSAKPATTDRPKTLYLRQDRILAGVTASFEEDPEPIEPTSLADHLRAQGVTILCDANTCTLINTSSTRSAAAAVSQLND